VGHALPHPASLEALKNAATQGQRGDGTDGSQEAADDADVHPL
jgi:hypothetical protein